MHLGRRQPICARECPRAHRRRRRLGRIAFLIGALVACSGDGHAGDVSWLVPEHPASRAISGRDVHRYRVVSSTRPLRLQLIKRGIDLELRISDVQGGPLFRIADWRDREGWLTALLERDTAFEFLLEVSAVSETAPPGEYVISLDELPLTGPEAGIRYEAEKVMTRADHARYMDFLDEGGSRAQALELFRVAGRLWNQIGFQREEARATFSLAMILQELGRMSDADRMYQAALYLWRSVGDDHGIAATLNQMGLIDQEIGQPTEALDHLSEARAIRERLGDTYFLAHALNNIGLIHTSLGQPRIAMKYLSQALGAYQGQAELTVPNARLRQEEYFQEQVARIQRGGDLLAAAVALSNLARIHSTLGEFGDALNLYENYRFLAHFLGSEEGVAQATLNIGQVYFQMAEHQKALDHLSRALEFFAGPEGNPYWHSLALDNLGKVHLQLGNYQRALDFFERALSLRSPEDNPKGRADTLQRLGEAHSALGEPARAIEYFDQSLELRETAVDRYREALTLDQMGVAQARLGRFDAALASHRRALEIHRAAGNSRGETESLVNLGRFFVARNQPAEALEYLQAALSLSRASEDRVWEAQALFELAKTDSELGRTRDSLTRLDEALSVIDSLRGDLISPELRASFFATQLEVHRFYIDQLMHLAESGEEAVSERAFVVAERAKQRTLLDYLANTGDTAANTDMDLLKRREELRRELDANEQERIWSAGRSGTAEQIALIDKKIRDLTAELEEVEIRIAGRRAPEQTFSETAVSVAQVAPLLGGDTVLLEYALGDDRSFVWVVGENRLDTAILPPGPEIETRVREVFAGLRDNDPSAIGSERDQLEQLGRMLIGPIAGQLGNKRLAIVPDGVLHYLPFGVLGDPRAATGRTALADSNEIVMLPSAAGLLGLRNRAPAAANQKARIAVLADPVFTTDDPRVVSGGDGASMTLGGGRSSPVEEDGRLEFSRLAGTLREAEIIEGLVEPGSALILTGFAANRDQLTNGSLDGYGILHLATHGIVNPTHPGLSGVVLSALDSGGRSQPSFIWALDLFYMEIGARLVVLSACETALGKEIRGEGLMGLTRGFFYAGANTVVSSLWQVPDRATAELMRHFYGEMLQNGRSPADALRQAQLEIRKQRRWRDPYYWAAFVVQGDWE